VRRSLFFIIILIFSVGTILSNSVLADEIETLDDVEEITDAWYLNPNQFPIIDRGVNVLSGKSLRPGTILMIFDHRVRESLSKDPFHDFLGFDAGGLKVGIGFRYGLIENLDLGLYRLNGTVENYDTYEFDARFQFLQQPIHHFDISTRFGFTWFSQKEKEDASGVFIQLLANKTLAHRFNVGTGLLYHSESSNSNKADNDQAHTFAIPFAFELRLSPTFSWAFESVTTVDGYNETYPAISTAIKIITHRHIFSILFTNTQNISSDGIITGSQSDFGDAAIGFTITKELGS